MIQNGKDLKVFMNGRCVAACKSCTIKVDHEPVDAISQSDWRWKESMPGKMSWSVQATGLTTDGIDLEAEVSNKVVSIEVRNDNTGDVLTGSAFVRSVNISAARGKIISYDVKLDGTGKLTTMYGFTPIDLILTDATHGLKYALINKRLTKNSVIYSDEELSIRSSSSTSWDSFAPFESDKDGVYKYSYQFSNDITSFAIGHAIAKGQKAKIKIIL